jgi:hypothetical protein
LEMSAFSKPICINLQKDLVNCKDSITFAALIYDEVFKTFLIIIPTNIMKSFLYANLLFVTLIGCKDAPKTVPAPPKPATPTAPVPAATPVAPAISVAKDTAIGIKGCEKATFDGKTYTYASTKVTVKASDGNAGETIEVNGTVIPNKKDGAASFAGVYKNFLFIEDGTGPNGSTLSIWGIKEKKVLFQTAYEGDLSLAGDKVKFIQPIDLKVVRLSKPVNCPDKAKWEKGGLSVGYGVPHQYDLVKLSATPVGDIVCFAVQ